MSDMADGFQPDPDVEEQIRSVMLQLGESARSCGLYLESAAAHVAGPDEAPRPILIVGQFAVGDLAFTDRVLDPPSEEDKKVVRTMEVDHQLDEFNETRRRLMTGEGPLGELADDDE